jgi:hypothetical protein
VNGVLVSGTQPTIGKAVIVYWREHPPLRAVLDGFGFHIDQWPPRAALVLDGVNAADLGTGAWVTTTLRDQHEGDYTEEQLDRLEQMIDSNEYSQDEWLEILSNPAGADRKDQSSRH